MTFFTCTGGQDRCPICDEDDPNPCQDRSQECQERRVLAEIGNAYESWYDLVDDIEPIEERIAFSKRMIEIVKERLLTLK